MTSKYIKVPAIQGVSSIQYNQILDFDLLNYGYIDPQRSYISVNADIATTETDPTSGVGVHAVYATYDNNATFKNSVFIGDYELRSSSVGVLESVLDSNVINSSFDGFNRDFEQVLSDNYKSVAQFIDPAGCEFQKVDVSPFRVISQTAPSQNITHQMKIKLPDISPMMKQIPVYDCEAMGNTRLRIRWDDFVLNDASEYLPYNTMWGVRGCANILDTAADRNKVVMSDLVLDAADLELTAAVANPQQDGTSVIVTCVVGPARQPLLETTVAGIVISGGQQATITLADNLPAGNLVNVAFATYSSKVAIATPANGATSVNVKDQIYSPIDLPWAKFTYFNKQVAISYPTAGAPVFSVQTITGVAITNDGTIKLTFANALNGAGNAAGSLYVLGSPATFSAVAGDNITYTFQNKTLKNCGLWVGQKIKISSIAGTGAKQAVQTVITSLAQNGNDVQVGVANAMAGTANTIKFMCVPAATTTLTFSNPMLVMKTLNSGNKKLARYLQAESKEVSFSTYSIERASILTGQRTFSRIFDCEPGCVNAFFLVVNKNNGELLPALNDLSSYRMRLNDIMITNRDVQPLTPLYYDGLVQCLKSSSLALLRNLGHCTEPDVCVPCAIIPNPTQLNRLQLNANFENGAQELVIYCVKEKMRMLSVGKGGVKLE